MQKSFFGMVLALLVSTQFLFAQTYVVSGIEKTDKEGMQYEVLGKVANRYWIFKKNGNNATIAQYNEQMQLVKQNDLSFLPASYNSIEFVTYPNKVFVFFQVCVVESYARILPFTNDEISTLCISCNSNPF